MWSSFISVFLIVILASDASKLIKLSCDDKKEFVDIHNDIRFSLYKGKINKQPAAPKIKSLSWEDELEDLAIRRLKKIVGHEWMNELNETERGKKGSNKDLVDCPEGKVSVEQIMEAWGLEHIYYKIQAFNRDKQRRGGFYNEHYTQIVWEATKRFGCAISKLEDEVCVILCYYEPKGNVPGELPYTISKTPGTANKLPCDSKICDQTYGKRCTPPALKKGKSKKKCKKKYKKKQHKKKKHSKTCNC